MTKAGSNNVTRRVLVVDDYPDAAEIACILLNILGHESRAAHSGRDALDLAFEYEPDIVLCDIGLPDISGYEVARALRARPNGHRAHLAALTGWGRPDDRARAIEAGFDQHVLKPLDVAKIANVMAFATGARMSSDRATREGKRAALSA